MLFTGQMVVGGSAELLKIWSGPRRNVGGKLTPSPVEVNRSVGEPAEGSLLGFWALPATRPLLFSDYCFGQWGATPRPAVTLKHLEV